MGNRPGSTIDKLKHKKNSSHLTSPPSSPIESASTIKTTHFETFILVWLDPNVDTNAENVQTQERLRKILTCLITFDTVDACEQWLKKCCSDEKILFIVSGAYGQEIIPKIHHLQAIISIYIYCLDIDRNKIWAQNFAKIRNIISSTDTLLHELSLDQINLESLEDSKALNIYKHEQQQVYSHDTKIVSFVCYQLLLEILISPNYITQQGTYYELIHTLRQYSSDDKYGSKLINEFQKTYNSNKAISWLTRDTPLSRFINKALREQDIHMLFTLRFLLVDIHSQLTTYQARSLHVYKLQLMLKNEMENIRANQGQLLAMNRFLFASTDKSQLISTITKNDQYEIVLFDIKADFRLGVAPFAFLHDIDSNIEHQIDREVLFMCGSIFEVGSLVYENNIWNLQLKLANENDSLILFHMKEKLRETKNLSIIGDLLNQYDQKEQANIYYERLFKELPKHHAFVSQINRQQLPRNNNRPNPISIPNVPFVVVNLSEHMSKFASAVLDILCSLTSDIISIMNDVSINDIYQWPKSSISIFTTTQFLSPLEQKKISKYFKTFVLNDDKNNIEQQQQQQFTTIDELICRLVDEIIQYYRSEANEFSKIGDSTKVQEQYKQINRIYRELRKIDEKLVKINSPLNKSENIEPILIWLISNTGHDEEDTEYIEKNFKDNFSSYFTFYDSCEFHSHLLDENNITDMFIIIDSNYEESIVECVRQFPYVKYVYYYGELKTKSNNIMINRDDLYYRITSDLIDYYAKLGEKYQTNKQSKEARKIFLKAQTLCRLLAENCFLSE
ncbi:unnamed protein product [Rotaria sordida]|uniref:Uncharacterized protein n=1 Tax=Rotaria sordida TaxID=392033 RepID=A0A813YHE9_9BILA|nr:unnamed protein product [Rotaria sordida]CAF3975630.1 unnamed protein product [Rotaria sordida]